MGRVRLCDEDVIAKVLHLVLHLLLVKQLEPLPDRRPRDHAQRREIGEALVEAEAVPLDGPLQEVVNALLVVKGKVEVVVRGNAVAQDKPGEHEQHWYVRAHSPNP